MMVALIIAAVLGLLVLMCLFIFAAVAGGFVVQLVKIIRYYAGGRQGPPPWAPQQSRRNAIPLPAEVRARVMARDEFTCVYCGATRDLTVDHVTPRILGGSNEMANLVTSCRPCNSSKGTSTSWTPGQRRRRLERRAIITLWQAERVHSRNGHH